MMVTSPPMKMTILVSFFLALFSLPIMAKLIPNDYGTQAIYGRDDRELISTKSSKQIKKLSESVALIVNKDLVENRFFHSIIQAKLLSQRDDVKICQDIPFANHHSVNNCTGFLIAPDLMVSAGHCFRTEEDCANKKVVFEVLADNEGAGGFKVSKRAVYGCQQIVKNAAEDDRDYAVIRLNRKVLDRAPLKLRRRGVVDLDESVFMIGHPLGLPQILSRKGFVNNIENDHYFKTSLDSFEGNSGSPVFNAKTLEVEGILVRGEDDFVEDLTEQCYRYKTYEDGVRGQPSLRGEGVSRISEILSK